ncbi:MAG: hypothetical protein WAV27_19975 [Xanthobacteraceae bacterium]
METFPRTTRGGKDYIFEAKTSNRSKARAKGVSVANNKNPNQKQPGEKEPGTFHYNPGNMSGKKIGANDNQSEQSDAHEKRGRQEHPEDTKKTVDN